jgi:hypothetical protein
MGARYQSGSGWQSGCGRSGRIQVCAETRPATSRAARTVVKEAAATRRQFNAKEGIMRFDGPARRAVYG